VDSARPKRKKTKRNFWPVKVFFITLLLASVFSFFSETALSQVTTFIALLVLFVLIAIGIIFDVIGIAVTYQEVTAYTAMASKKIRGAKHAIRLVQSASMVSNICNDVVGDICGNPNGNKRFQIT
jgi:predicted membrane protein